MALAVATLPVGSFLRNPANVVLANNTAQSLPFTQNWSNTGLITANDDWSGVPGIEGYFIRNDAVSTTGVDPQTLTGDTFGGAGAPELDVIANQTAPNTLSNGGVAEFEQTQQAAPSNTNPVSALNGSGTADAPFILINLNTTGQSAINVAYNLRDIDCTVDNSVQPVALMFRVGNTGSYTNVAAGFVADASARVNTGATDTANCTQTTAVSATLPAGADNQPLVQVRIISTNAAGNDEWVGIDDISITAEAAPAVSSTTPTNGATDVLLNSDVTVTFSEAVTAPSGAFTINCATSGAHTFALSGGPTTFTLNPDSDFTNSEVCTVTVDDAQVTDQDTADPPDNMAADFVFSFTTVGATPTLNISDVTQSEGDAGTTTFTFNVTLTTAAGGGGVTFDIATADGTAEDDNPATEDNDYVAQSLTGQSIGSGSTGPYQFNVTVNGDMTVETNETFFVNVTNITGATAGDTQGQGTISNDDLTITPIHTIQGSGDTSPLNGTVGVTTTGLVTLLRTGSNAGGGTANGFFLQTPDAGADADPNTSEGIFVFTSSVPTYTAGGSVAVGDELRVTGTVTEFNGLTEIGSVTNITVIDTGNTLPTAVTLTATILDPMAAPTQPQLEKYEGMRMTGTLKTVAPNNNFFEVDTVLSTVARPMREPGIPFSDPIPPDPTSGLPDCCIPIWDENPERLSVDTNGRAGSPNNPYTSNVTFTSVSGPLDYSFGRYRLIPDASPTASANMTAVALPTPLSTEFTIASFNIENFNNNATQRQKAADTIRTLLHYPDIIGTVEIFDLADLQALRDEINNDAVGAGDPNPMYEAYLIEQDGVSEDSDQDVGFLVKTSRVSVTSVTQEREEETFIEPGGGSAILHDRPPLVLDATIGATDVRVLVVVNHLRSFIDVDLVAGDGPRVREKRKKQAESLADLLNDLQTANPGVPVISVGDYNAYQFNSGYDDSLSVIKGNPTADDEIVVDQSPDLVNPNLTNLTDALSATEQYSFMFDGTPQALDHHVVNQAALARNTRIAIARVNSDFPEDPAATYASNAATPERNSDHDPVVSYYSLTAKQAAGSVIISEFRFRGPGFIAGPPEATLSQKIAMPGIKMPTLIAPVNQAEDEFIEIYNNSDSDIIVSTTDGSAGWAVVAADGVIRFIIPNNTVMPARGHFLGVNTDGYSLANYGGLGAAAGNSVLLADGVTPASGYTQDIPDGSGIALFRSANSVNFTLAERLDAAGYTGVDALYREGTGFATGGAETTSDLEHTFFRTMTRATGGLPKDTGDNTADFFLADTAGTDFDPGPGTNQRLGAPGPENLSSPINRTAQFGYALLDPSVSQEANPNRERNATVISNGDFGTLTLRRTFTNNTGETLSRLRFRIVDVTTFPSPAASGLADLRALTSGDEVISTPGRGNVLVRGTTLDQPPSQSLGGGWNASLNVQSIGGGPPTVQAAKTLFDTPTTGTIVLSAPLNNGEALDVQFKLGVMQTGRFFFYLVIEPTVGVPAEAAIK